MVRYFFPTYMGRHRMGLYLLSALGLPFMAVAIFALLEAFASKAGFWIILSDAGIDLCRVSIGIAGAIFLDVQMRAAGTFAAFILMLELIVSLAAMLIEKRAVDMGIEKQWVKAFGILACGIISMVIPAILIVQSGVHNGK
jgi:hypothetical protein